MNIVDFQKFINAIDKEINDKYKIESNREKAYARMTKVVEEVGETANALGCYFGQQRQEKLADEAYCELGLEMADIIITTFLLAKVVDVDLENALRTKIKKIICRTGSGYYKDINL